MAEAIESQVDAQEPPEPAPKPKRPRGKPRANGVPAGSMPVVAKDIPNPRIRKYYSDHDNPAQKTKALWSWWNQLPTSMKEIVEAHVYREWPVLLDPVDEKEYKYIDKIIGMSPVQSDHDFVDMYGAGDFKIYLNVNPAAAPRRTLAEAWVKCSHDFTKYPPSDNRVINVDNISQTDPSNKAYVGWLRSQGKLKDEVKEAKEAEEMAATGNVMAELVKDMAQDRRELTEKLLTKIEQDKEIPTDPPPSPQEVISEQLGIFKSLKELVPTADPLEMVKQVIGMAQVLTQKDGSASADLKPLMEEISKLREESRATEREFFRTQLAELKERLQAKETQNPNVLLPDGSNLNSIVEKAVAKAVENGLGEQDNSWWVDPLKQLMPVAVPALIQGLGNFLRPAPPQPFPMPPAHFQPGQQAQLPAPAQPQQAAPQPQTSGAFTTGNAPLDNLLMQITVPLADALRDGDTGEQFAEFFISEFGYEIFTQLASFGVDPVVTILYSYPPLTSTLKPLPREKVVKFITEFAAFKPSAEPQPA